MNVKENSLSHKNIEVPQDVLSEGKDKSNIGNGLKDKRKTVTKSVSWWIGEKKRNAHAKCVPRVCCRLYCLWCIHTG